MSTQSANVCWQLWIVAIGFFMQTLDTTIVNTAIPAMAHDLGVSPLHMHSVIVYYVLTVAVMLPVSGWLRVPEEVDLRFGLLLRNFDHGQDTRDPHANRLPSETF